MLAFLCPSSAFPLILIKLYPSKQQNRCPLLTPISVLAMFYLMLWPQICCQPFFQPCRCYAFCATATCNIYLLLLPGPATCNAYIPWQCCIKKSKSNIYYLTMQGKQNCLQAAASLLQQICQQHLWQTDSSSNI